MQGKVSATCSLVGMPLKAADLTVVTVRGPLPLLGLPASVGTMQA